MADYVAQQRLRQAAIVLVSFVMMLAVGISWQLQRQLLDQSREINDQSRQIEDQSQKLGDIRKENLELKEQLQGVRNKIGLIPRLRVVHFRNPGLVFNSWENEIGDPSRFIRAWGRSGKLDWVVTDNEQVGSFSYAVNDAEAPSDKVCSGGYVTFYLEPLDRLLYQSLRFRCRATEAAGEADIGVRMVVDNPRTVGDRDWAVFQFNSVRHLKPINSNWNDYEIPFEDFEMTKIRPPFPDGLDVNTINKVVFYVDAEKAKVCPRATLSFGDITFVPKASE